MAKNNQPLSPHLSIYKWQITNTLSILHRFSGVLLFLAAIDFSIWLASIAMGENSYAVISGLSSNWLALVFWVAVSFVIFVGAHVAALPVDTMNKHDFIDAVCQNEGVYTISNLAQAVKNGTFDASKIAGLGYMHPDGYPVHVYSHGNMGFGGASPFLMRHFASHGWVVVAPDHTGNTFTDHDNSLMPELVFRRPKDIADSVDWLFEFPDRSPESRPIPVKGKGGENRP